MPPKTLIPGEGTVLNFQPAQPLQAREEEAPTLNFQNRGVLSNEGEDDPQGVVKNIATSTIKGLADIPGQAGNLRSMPGHLADLAVSRLTKLGFGHKPMEPDEVQRIREKTQERATKNVADLIPGGSWALRQYEKIPRWLRPLPSGADIAEPVLQQTGRYEPETTAGKYAAAGIQGGVSMIGPGALTKPVQAVEGLAAGTLAPMAGLAAGHYLGPEAEFAANLVVPSLVGKTVRTGHELSIPFRPKALEREADRRFREQTSDPDAVKKALELYESERWAPSATPGGTPHTTAEVTQDKLHARAQDLLETTKPGFKERLMTTVFGPRNAQSRAVFDKVATNASPLEVADGFQQHLDDLRSQTETVAGQPANVTGEALREVGQKAKEAEKARLDKLKRSIDPDGTMNVVVDGVVNHAKEMLDEPQTRPQRRQSPAATKMYEQALTLGDGRVAKLSDLIDLDQNLTQAMKDSKNSDVNAYSRFSVLKGRVKAAIHDAVANQHAFEQDEVARGAMAPENTLAARLAAQRDAWQAARQGQTPAAAAAPGVPNLTPEAAQALTEFNKRYGQYKETYDKGPVGEALQTEFGGKPSQLSAEVAKNAFTPGTKGYEIAQMWLHAGGPEALAALKDIAIGRLSEGLKPGEALDQARLDAWRGKHADALRAIDEVDGQAGGAKFSERFDNAATAQQTVQTFQKSAAAKFMGLEHPDDISNMLGRIMNSDTGATRISNLMEQARATGQNSDAIIAGMRRAGAEWIKREFSNQSEVPTGQGTGTARLLSDNLKGFIEEKRNMLETLFEPSTIEAMDKVAESMRKSVAVRSMAAAKGSPTAMRQSEMLKAQLALALKQDARSGNLSVGGSLNMAAGMELIREFPSLSAAAHAAGLMYLAHKVNEIRSAIAAKWGKGEVAISDLVADGFEKPEVAKAMLERAVDAQGQINVEAYRKLYRAILGAQGAEQATRGPFAGGGKVSAEHIKAAQHMVNLVQRARKTEQDATKPLLRSNDSMVASALAAASRSI